MKKVNNNELKKITGGSITGTFINSITKGINTFLALGRAVGSAIRRVSDGSICPV